MLSFKKWILLEESEKRQKVCYMINLKKDDAEKFKKIQDSFDIKAGEIVKSDEFHCTIRFMKTSKDPQPLLDYLNEQKLPKVHAKIKSFDRLNDAFVAKLETPEMHEWFDKVNKWIVENGYPDSDYNTFLPHISFSYETDEKWETPKFDEEKHALELEFDYHTITSKPEEDNGPDYKEIWGKQSK